MERAQAAELATSAQVVVVKVGTRVLTDERGRLNAERVAGVARQLAELAASGRRVALVSSGSVGAGLGRLGLQTRPTDLAKLQAAAAVGQSLLIEAYNRTLQSHGLSAAQVLLTADDLNRRDRYLNIRNTLHELFALGAVPIVNENDTVRVDELQLNVGDNDRLAALVSGLIPADLLVLLTDIEGLYDRDPLAAGAAVIPLVRQIDEEVLQLAAPRRASGIALSTGGMASKLEAAKTATAAGAAVVVADGRRDGVLPGLLAGEPLGTLFLPQPSRPSGRKRWIGWSVRPTGVLTLDNGAVRAVVQGGGSLLPVGVAGSSGSFGKGDVVSLVDPAGREVARGLTNYDREAVEQIRGKDTEAIAAALGHFPYTELVHRDNLTLVSGSGAT